MFNIDKSVTRQERVARAKKIGISRPIPFYVPILALLLTTTLVTVALVYSIAWLVYAAIVPELATLLSAIIAHDSYNLLNESVLCSRERAIRQHANVAQWDRFIAELDPPVKLNA